LQPFVKDLAYEGGGGVGQSFLLAAQGNPLQQAVEERLWGVEHWQQVNTVSPAWLQTQ
jgi:hypothetical protein